MRKRPDIVALILFVMLTAYAAAQQIFIIPVLQALIAQAGAALAFPSRLSISISQTGLVGFGLFIATVLFALNRSEPKGDRAQQARVLNIASIVVAVFIGTQASLFVDFAKTGGQISRALQRQTAAVTTVAPAATVR